MPSSWLLAFASVAFVSCISLIGVATISIAAEKLQRAALLLVSFAAGALFGDVFFHLLPELAEEGGLNARTAVWILAGIAALFVIEKIIHWRHCHLPESEGHIHPLAVTNIVGDWLHNCLDGLIIGASYLASLPVGIATTVAIILHEIPQEISDFAVLLHSGLSKRRALLLNFISALGAVFGAAVALFAGSMSAGATAALIPLSIGAFIYIAGADLIPELHKELQVKKSILQFAMLVSGMAVMALLLLLE